MSSRSRAGWAGLGWAGDSAVAAKATAKHRVAVEYHDLYVTQDASLAFVSHAQGFHFFEFGKPAFVLVRVRVMT